MVVRRGIGRVAAIAIRHHLPIFCDQRRFCSGCPDVNRYYRLHIAVLRKRLGD